jgi:hypothetical protein
MNKLETLPSFSNVFYEQKSHKLEYLFNLESVNSLKVDIQEILGSNELK